jgi:hypothetical protein
MLIEDGANPNEVMVEMGRSNIAMTYDLYGHLFTDEDADTSEQGGQRGWPVGRGSILAKLDVCFRRVKLIGIAARESRLHDHQVLNSILFGTAPLVEC